MHRSMNIKFINAKQVIDIHAYKNTKRKLYKTNAVVWFNKTCRDEDYKTASCWYFYLIIHDARLHEYKKKIN
jgi:hypothetical protein